MGLPIGMLILIVAAVIVVGAIIVLAIVSARKETTVVTGEGSYFDGNTWQLIGYRILSALVNTITLGIAYPWMLCMVQRWETKHTIINGRRLKFNGKGVQLIGKWILWVFLTIITFGIYGIWLGLGMKKWVVKHTVYADDEQPVDSYFSGGAGGFLGIHLLSFVLTVFTLGIGKAWADKMVLCWEAKHTHIGGSPLEFNGKGGQLFVKYILLALLTPLTLGIYALFFPVIYIKWQTKNTVAVYQKPEIQEEARAHEIVAVQDYAKYRIAANDTEIAMMKSGYTGNETTEELKALAEQGNPYACYHLATQLKADAPVYENRALELLQIAANAKYYPAQFDLAQQLPKEQAIPMLKDSARNGSSVAPWLLVNHYNQNGSLKEAAYWFKVALEWSDSNALAQRDNYDVIIKNIALQLSETNQPLKLTSALPIVLSIVGGVMLLLVIVCGFLGIRWFGSAKQVDEGNMPVENVQGGWHIHDVHIVQPKTIDNICGEDHDSLDYHGNTIHYIFDRNMFFDYEQKVLYFEFGVIEYDFPICLTDKVEWQTEEITESGIFKVSYPYDTPPEKIAVRGETFISREDTANIIKGTTAEAKEWLENKYNSDSHTGESTKDDADNQGNNTQNNDVQNTETPATSETPTVNIAEGIVGKWELQEIIYDHYDHVGEEVLYTNIWTFSNDGRCEVTYEYSILSTNETYMYYDGRYWEVFDGVGESGTYNIDGDNLEFISTIHDGDTTYSHSRLYTVVIKDDTLQLHRIENGDTKTYSRKQ